MVSPNPVTAFETAFRAPFPSAALRSASDMPPSVPHSTFFTWLVVWLQLLVRAVFALLGLVCTTAYLPLRLLLSPCLGDCATIGRRKTFRSILITGASSGIGAALAEAYAGQEGMRLVLVARRAQKLRAVAAACEAKGATVDVMEGDVCDREAMRRLVHAADDKQPLDLVLANAGVQAEILGQATRPHPPAPRAHPV